MSSCHQTYTGIYFLNRSHNVSRAQSEEIAQGLAVALASFGFSQVREPEDNPMVSFAGRKRPVSPELAKLVGSDATISIVVRLDRPSITIRDMSNTEETAFVKAIKRSIALQLEDSGVSGAHFERQRDFLFY